MDLFCWRDDFDLASEGPLGWSFILIEMLLIWASVQRGSWTRQLDDMH